MSWRRIYPRETKRHTGTDDALCEVWSSGQLALNVRVWESLGEPARIAVEIDPTALKLRLRPADPRDPDAFAINATDKSRTRRLQLRYHVTRFPALIGTYNVERANGVLTCTRIPD